MAYGLERYNDRWFQYLELKFNCKRKSYGTKFVYVFVSLCASNYFLSALPIQKAVCLTNYSCLSIDVRRLDDSMYFPGNVRAPDGRGRGLGLLGGLGKFLKPSYRER